GAALVPPAAGNTSRLAATRDRRSAHGLDVRTCRRRRTAVLPRDRDDRERRLLPAPRFRGPLRVGRTDRPPHVGHVPPDVVGGCGVRKGEVRAHVLKMTDKSSSGMTELYSAVVKTAVSIPDPIFAAADR